MRLDIPRAGLALLVAAVVFAVALTIYLLPRFGGPSLSLTQPYHVLALVPDAQSLETEAVVLDRGVQIGTVGPVSVRGSMASVTLDIDPRYAPLYRDATVRIGQRTAIGDAFVDVVRGSTTAGPIANGGAIAHVSPNVDFDQAFATFTAPARTHATTLIRTFGVGAAAPQTAARWGLTVSQLSRVVQQAADLTAALDGQKRAISTLVNESDLAMAELGKRQRALTAIVTGGRRVLAAFGEHEIDLGATLRELPTLVSTARSTLGNIRPLLVQAKPLARDLTSAAPRLRAAAAALPATAGAARDLVAKLPTLDATALPFLRRALPVLTAARPFARVLLPVLENLVPILEYAAPRADDLAGWFSKTLSGGLQQDSKGHWVRFLVFVDPQVAGGIDRGAQYRNPYPGPQDAAHPQPFMPGSYPRLQPYFPK